MRKSSFGLSLLLLSLFIINCETVDFDSQTVVDEEFIINFSAEYGTGADIEFSDAKNPIVINKGESVVYKNTSTYQIEYGDGRIESIDISDPSYWEFNGGSPIVSAQNIETVTYASVGKFNVTLNVERDGQNSGMLFPDYVEVIDDAVEPEKYCFIGKEETSDGFETEFFYEAIIDSLPIVLRADKRADGVLKEYSLFTYGSDRLLKSEEFYLPDNTFLGDINYTRDSEKRIINQITKDASGVLIEEVTFNWGDDVVTAAEAQIGIGLGLYIVSVIVYVYDSDMTNVTEVTATQDGDQIYRAEYQYDDKVNLFSGLGIQKFPERFNANNPTSILSYDENNELVETRTSTYIYDSDAESPCFERPVSEKRTVNGVTVDFVYTNYKY